MRHLLLLLAIAASGWAQISSFPPSSSSGSSYSNLTQNADGSLNAAKALTVPSPSAPTFNGGGTTTCDLSASNVCGFTATGSSTLAMTNPHGGGPYMLKITMDGTGARAITYPGSFQNVCAPSPTASEVTTISLLYDGSANYYQMACTSTDTGTLIVGPERAAPSAPATGGALSFDSTRHTPLYQESTNSNKHIMPKTAGSTDQLACADLSDAGAGCTGAGGGSGTITPNTATGAPAITALPTTGWTNVNSGVVNDSLPGQAIDFFVPANGSLNWRLYARSLQSLSTYTVVMSVNCMQNVLSIVADTCGALYLYDGTKIAGYEVLFQSAGSGGNFQLRIEQITSVTVDSSTVFGATQNLSAVTVTVKVVEDGVHRTWSHWATGAWVQDLQQNTGTFLTPTQFGFGGLNLTGDANNANLRFAGSRLLYFCLANTTTITTSSTCL